MAAIGGRKQKEGVCSWRITDDDTGRLLRGGSGLRMEVWGS